MRSCYLMLACAAAVVGSGCWPGSKSASVVLPGETTVTMTVWPIFSLQSDWHRELAISTASKRVSKRLFEDTGWWRGSNLYVHKSGTYVLHEGQNGCLMFEDSPAFASSSEISCEKLSSPHNAATVSEFDRMGRPQSRFYPDLFYLGRFVEVLHDPNAIRFMDHNQQPEIELPNMM